MAEIYTDQYLRYRKSYVSKTNSNTMVGYIGDSVAISNVLLFKMLTEDKLWGIKIFDAIFQIVRTLAFRK